MKKIIKILSRLLGVILFLVLIIFAIRFINDHRYRALKNNLPKEFENVTDWNIYPKKLESIEVKEVHHGAAQGFHLIPKEKKYPGIILCYGGSEGSPNFTFAKLLSKNGFETLALFMFGQENQPRTLLRIPLEEFVDVKSYLKEMKIEGPISVYGASKGAEYVLNLAVHYPEIKKVVAFAPASHNFAGLDQKEIGSSWTYRNKELPYINIRKSDFSLFLKNIFWPMLTHGPVYFEPTYSSALGKNENSDESRIFLEKTKAKVMLVAGGEDGLWPSAKMAKELKKSRPENTFILIYPKAGHVFFGDGNLYGSGMLLKTGGSAGENKKAFEDSNKKILEFFESK